MLPGVDDVQVQDLHMRFEQAGSADTQLCLGVTMTALGSTSHEVALLSAAATQRIEFVFSEDINQWYVVVQGDGAAGELTSPCCLLYRALAERETTSSEYAAEYAMLDVAVQNDLRLFEAGASETEEAQLTNSTAKRYAVLAAGRRCSLTLCRILRLQMLAKALNLPSPDSQHFSGLGAKSRQLLDRLLATGK